MIIKHYVIQNLILTYILCNLFCYCAVELKNISTYKGNTILVVMMEHPSYADWSDALDEPDKQVDLIMGFVKEFHIDGIQFSNLQPSV